MTTCTCCKRERKYREGQNAGYYGLKEPGWWTLSGYFGLSGFFCPTCYDKVRHDAYGKPVHPRSYRRILKELTT